MDTTVFAKKLIKDKPSSKILLKFLAYLEGEVDNLDELMKQYYILNRSWMDMDHRERRHISHFTQTLKQVERSMEIERERQEKLRSVLNTGFDINTFERRKITRNECIITLFETGRAVKTQELEGIHIILEKNVTLQFDPTTNIILYSSPIRAEQLDDEYPNKYSFIDSSGGKHTCKFIYSKRFHVELYEYLMGKISLN